jgi:hypothetical protein
MDLASKNTIIVKTKSDHGPELWLWNGSRESDEGEAESVYLVDCNGETRDSGGNVVFSKGVVKPRSSSASKDEL